MYHIYPMYPVYPIYPIYPIYTIYTIYPTYPIYPVYPISITMLSNETYRPYPAWGFRLVGRSAGQPVGRSAGAGAGAWPMVNFGGGQLWRWSRGGCRGALPPALMFGPEVETEVETEVEPEAGRPAGRPLIPPTTIIIKIYTLFYLAM